MLLKTIIFVLIIWQVEGKNKTCNDLLRELGDKQSKFVDCVTTHSVPVTLCTNCQLINEDMVKLYDNLTASPNCSKMYFNKDRINMVGSVEAAMTGLWTKAYCPDCFNNNNSLVFNDKNDTLDMCLTEAFNLKVNPCKTCITEYLNLNTFYIHLDQYNNGEVCYDLQDSMNRTRNLWSKELKCCQREFDMTLFSIALGMTFCLPLFFYGGTYYFTKRQERNHGILNDEDPLFNSTTHSAPATSNINISNMPSTSNGNNSSNNITNKKVPAVTKKGFNILDEDMEEYNPTTLGKKKAVTKQGFDALNEHGDDSSSDDENIAINVNNSSKEKLK